MLELFKRLWIGWNRGVRGLMRLQTRALMTAAYLLAIGPAALTFRLLRRSLLDRGPAPRGATTFWLARPNAEATMRDATRPF